MDIEAAMTAFSCWGREWGGGSQQGLCRSKPVGGSSALANAILEPRLGAGSSPSSTQATPTPLCLPRPHRHEQLDGIREVAQEG